MPRYDPRDRFFRKAKAEGLRARSAYKLDEIQRRFRVVPPGGRVLDLGAAPGGWLQVAAREAGPRGFVLGVDLEPIARLPGPVETWVADALAPELAARLRAQGRAPYHAVLSDLAPRTSGIREADEARSLELAERALALALGVLEPSGSFVVKVFMGGGFEAFLRTCKASFSKVRVARPEPSVARRSRELYIVGTGPRGAQAALESSRKGTK
jgi:23S rRNA (uridine2552-2'-O)-methyltransferase